MTAQKLGLTPFTLEPFNYESDAQYEAVVALNNAHFPEYPDTPDDWKRWDKKRNPDHLYERYIVREPSNDAIVACGYVMHTSGSFHPQKFRIGGFVARECEGNGIGRNLYNHLLQCLEPHNPIKLEIDTRSDLARAVRFIEDRGYKEATREYCSELDLNTFDASRFAGYARRSAEAGVVIKSLTELIATDPDHKRKIYDMNTAIMHDVPWHDTYTPHPYEQWLKFFDDAHNRIDDAFLIATDGDDYVGVTMLFKSGATTDRLFTGLTGVLRSHRRKGVAIALKLQSLGYAQQNFRTSEGKMPVVMTENEENNPMYTINERLGFVRQPDWLCFTKELNE